MCDMWYRIKNVNMKVLDSDQGTSLVFVLCRELSSHRQSRMVVKLSSVSASMQEPHATPNRLACFANG